MASINFNDYKYADLVELGKEYGINGQNMKRSDLEKLIATRMEQEENKDFSQNNANENPDTDNVSVTKKKKHSDTNVSHKTFETTKKVEFNVNGEKFSGTIFTFPIDIFEDRKRIVRENYGEEIFK